MTPAETADFLRRFNAWRRGSEDIPMLDPFEIGRAIDVAVELLDETERLRAQNAVFAELVSKQEREACAKICDEWNTAATDILAAEIRARGERK